MTRTRSITVTVLIALALASGCAAEEVGNPIDLSNSLSEGKSDSIDGKRLEPVFTGIERIRPGTPYEGKVEVETVGDAIIEVTGPRLIVEAGVDRRIRFAVEKRGIDPFTELRFVIGLREAGGGDWTLIEFEGTATYIIGGTRDITINYFDFLQIDAGEEEVTFKYSGETFTRPFLGARGVDVEYFVMAFPESGWGSLDGTYKYTLHME